MSLIVAGYEVCKEDGDEHGEAVRDLARHLEDDHADGEGVRHGAREGGRADGGVPAGDDLAPEPHVHRLAADPEEGEGGFKKLFSLSGIMIKR